jgi:hypothetical protein
MVSLRYRWAIFKNNTKDKPIGRYWAPTLAVCLFGLLAIVSSLLWIEVQRRFPLLPPGSYQGEFTRAVGDDEPIRMYVESTPDESLLIALLRPGWEPQQARLVPVDSRGESKEARPVIIKGQGGRLQFTGSMIENGEFRGVVTNLESGKEGLWKLVGMKAGQEALTSDEEERLRHWLKIRVNLQNEKEKLTELQSSESDREAQLRHLASAIQDGEPIDSEDPSSYENAREDFEELQMILKKKLKEARQLEQKVKLAHKVTHKGKLVSLAREAAQRDNRWIESMTRSEPASLSPDLQEALQYATQLQELQRQIAEEQHRIGQLQSGAWRNDRMELPGRGGEDFQSGQY